MSSIRCFALSLVCLLQFHHAVMAQRERPDILVQIYVKGLRTDLLDNYRVGWGSDGFNWVMKQGAVAPDISYPYPLTDEVAILSSLSAGAPPEIHGIYQAETYDVEAKRRLSTFTNKDYRGINNAAQLAPEGVLRSELLGDVVRSSSQGKSIVYVLASKSNEALAVAGHDAEGAVWIDPYSGLWATTNFYGSLPALALKANNERRILGGQKTPRVWTPLHTSPKDIRFSHSFEGAWRMADLQTSPFANDAIIDLAMDFIRYAHTAHRSTPALITLVLNLEVGSQGIAYADSSLEQQDAYRRLDANVREVISLLQGLYGMDHYALSILGIPGNSLAQPKYPSRRIVTYFDPAKSIALSNLYLSAIYGRKDWVVDYSNQTLHLNKKEIVDNNVDMQEMSNNLATFVSEMEGVIGAIPAYQLQMGLSQPSWAKLLHSRSYCSYAGDVLLALAPFTEVVGDAYGNDHHRRRRASAPFILMASGVVSQRLLEAIPYDCIAPSLAYLLCVSQPLSADASPLFILFNRK